MSGSNAVAAFLAFVIAASAFIGVGITAPIGAPMNAVSNGGLRQYVVFDRESYKALDRIGWSMILSNPSNQAITMNVSVNYDVFRDGVSDALFGFASRADWEVVTVPAWGQMMVRHATYQPLCCGWYEVIWGDGGWGVGVARCDAVARIITNKDRYAPGEFGNATFEFYNPYSYPVTIGSPMQVRIYRMPPDKGRNLAAISFIDWFGERSTIEPGGRLRIVEWMFRAPAEGDLVFEGMDARATVRVQSP